MIEYDYSKLLGRIVEKFGGQRAFAKAIGMSERSLSLKMNNKVQFKQREIDACIVELALTDEDIPAYFFTRVVQIC